MYITQEKLLFIIGIASLENSDCFQLLLKTAVNSYRDVLVGLKLTVRHYKFMMQYLSLLIPTTKIFSEGNHLGGVFVLCCIIFSSEIAFKTTMGVGELGGGGGTNSKR